MCVYVSGYVAQGNSNFSTLLAVIRADPVLNATISDVNTMVTVFAPTNAAFA